jgi:hypothetical protein
MRSWGIASIVANLHSRERSGKVTNFLHKGFETVDAGPDLCYSKRLVASLRGSRNVQPSRRTIGYSIVRLLKNNQTGMGKFLEAQELH